MQYRNIAKQSVDFHDAKKCMFDWLATSLDKKQLGD